ncbi:MAG: nitronate monooxygenase family protein [Dialister sp.]|nr:nitronate monooxygenase family protein [Dialister sp.]
MKFPALHIGDLTARIPIVQGGMGIGISLSGLAGAVAAEGGIGVISAAQIGYREPDFIRNTIKANLRAIASEIKKARTIAKGGVLGMNIMTKGQNYEIYAKQAAQSGIDIIFSGAGLPADLPACVEGTKTKIAPIIGSVKAARVLLKLWARHHNRTADMVVIEGPKAGGHLGYTREEIKMHETDGYEKEIIEILAVVREFEYRFKKKIPVIFGGGVFSKDDIERYLSLGLSGVQMGTRFVATEECDAARSFKEMYVRSKKEDITIVQSPVHMPGRALLNPFVKRVLRSREQITNCFHCLKTCDPHTTPYCITMALIRAVRGDVDNALIFCGANAYRIKEITTVHNLIHELTD